MTVTHDMSGTTFTIDAKYAPAIDTVALYPLGSLDADVSWLLTVDSPGAAVPAADGAAERSRARSRGQRRRLHRLTFGPSRIASEDSMPLTPTYPGTYMRSALRRPHVTPAPTS